MATTITCIIEKFQDISSIIPENYRKIISLLCKKFDISNNELLEIKISKTITIKKMEKSHDKKKKVRVADAHKTPSEKIMFDDDSDENIEICEHQELVDDEINEVEKNTISDHSSVLTYFLPILYKKDANGVERMWKTWVMNNQVFWSSGITTGKQLIKNRFFNGNKSTPNKNEHALLMAKRKWILKLDKGYIPKDNIGLNVYEKLKKIKSNQGNSNIKLAERIFIEFDESSESSQPTNSLENNSDYEDEIEIKEIKNNISSSHKKKLTSCKSKISNKEKEKTTSEISSCTKKQPKSSKTIFEKEQIKINTQKINPPKSNSVLEKDSIPQNGHSEGERNRILTQTKNLMTKDNEKLKKEKEKEETIPLNENKTLPGYTCSYKPMLCQVYNGNDTTIKKHFDFKKGVFIQPKLDGIRCLVIYVNGIIVLTSRTGKQFMWLSHIREQFLKLYNLIENKNIVFDCELYANEIYAQKSGKTFVRSSSPLDASSKFNFISGACKVSLNNANPLETEISAHIFDLLLINEKSEIENLEQKKRFEILNEIWDKVNKQKFKNICLVETKIIYSSEDIKKNQIYFEEKGYEGVVFRAHDLLYNEGKKTLKIRKYKNYLDGEYEIVGIECDDGVSKEHFTWTCKTENNLIFNCKPMGKREDKLDFYENKENYIGKMLTVRYQEIIDGIPRFCRGVAIRDYE